MSATSATLLERLRDSRDAEAWGRLNDLYAPLIRMWAERFGVRGADADDLVQEVLAVVVRRFPEFVHPERPGAFRGWLRAIAPNCARDPCRAPRLAPTAPAVPDFGNYLAARRPVRRPRSRVGSRARHSRRTADAGPHQGRLRNADLEPVPRVRSRWTDGGRGGRGVRDDTQRGLHRQVASAGAAARRSWRTAELAAGYGRFAVVSRQEPTRFVLFATFCHRFVSFLTPSQGVVTIVSGAFSEDFALFG